jgi:hypothetical protein
MYRLERCPQGRWELAQMRPQADLLGDVVRYAGYLEHGGWSINNREVASPIVPLIINFGMRPKPHAAGRSLLENGRWT